MARVETSVCGSESESMDISKRRYFERAHQEARDGVRASDESRADKDGESKATSTHVDEACEGQAVQVCP